MALQNSRILPASTVAVNGLNVWPISFLSSSMANPSRTDAKKKPLPDCAESERGLRRWRLLVAADDGHAGNVLARRAAQIVRHADARVLELTGTGLALDLQ